MVLVLVLARVLHVVLAMWFVAGLAGRTYTLRAARRSDDIALIARLTELARGFDRYFVIPGSQAVLVLGLLTAWLGGYPLLGFLQGASANWLLASLLLFGLLVAMVPTVFIPSGKVFDSAMQQALVAGEVTTGLTTALNSPRVAWAHRIEFIVVAAIVVLMVAKPF
jgi:uncharacterized membrane protein